MEPARFRSVQADFFREADSAHFRWQTEGPYFAATESALLGGVTLSARERLLEIGCGHGANLVHLRRRLGPAARLFAVDFSAERAGFAARAAGARVTCADAGRLPFCDAAFDAVLIRDLLHHVPDRAAVLAETARVLAPGGRLTVIEPNGRNPLMALAAAAEPAERGMLSSTAERAMDECARAGFGRLALERRQPLPLSRLVLHYRLGRPSLGARAGVARALRGIETLAERLPRGLWAYFIIRGVRGERAEAVPGHEERS
jgi:SAM-dependent methyltransferase